MRRLPLNTASTGVAAGDYEEGATAHSMFGIPVDDSGARATQGRCNIGSTTTARAQRAELLRAAVLVTWDELPMTHRFDLEAVDQLLQEVRGCKEPFGGVVFVGGGDFRQTAPVVKGRRDARRRREPFVDKLGVGAVGAIDTTELYRHVHLPDTIKAFTDVGNALAWATPARVAPDRMARETYAAADFSAELERVHGKSARALDEARARQRQLNHEAALRWADTAILAPFNADVDELNAYFSERVPEDAETLLAYDRERASDGTVPLDGARGGGEVADAARGNAAAWDGGEQWTNIDPDLLDTIGAPTYRLTLKVGDVVMCMRNLATSEGLVNGTRLVVRKIHAAQRLIECETLRADMSGARRRFFIPRINFSITVMGKEILRRQYPLRLAYTMTLNKSQGKTFQKGLLVLRRDVFSHGQLY
eukprot:gene6370-142_t